MVATYPARVTTLDAAALHDDPSHPALRDRGPTAHERLEEAEVLAAIRTAMQTALTPRQREVLIALAIDGVPIDVLAERLGTTRGALYKMLHDARRKLRATLAADGLVEPPSERREVRR